MHGESTIAAKTRPGKRTATEVAAAAEMHTAAEMPAAMTAEMTAAMKMPAAAVTASTMTTPVASTAMTTAAAFRSGITGRRERGRKNKNGNSKIEFWHRTLRGCGHLNLY
jgi:hypothetical protein